MAFTYCSGCGEKPSVLYLLFQLIDVALKGQRHSETVLHNEHHVIVSFAKAFLVGLYSHIGLHHGSSEDKLQLIVFKLIIKSAKRTSAGVVGGGRLEGFIYGYGINLFHSFLTKS